jgi:hypothetical protein
MASITFRNALKGPVQLLSVSGSGFTVQPPQIIPAGGMGQWSVSGAGNATYETADARPKNYIRLALQWSFDSEGRFDFGRDGNASGGVCKVETMVHGVNGTAEVVLSPLRRGLFG